MSAFPLDDSGIRALRSLCELCAEVTDVPLYLRGMVERAEEPLRSACATISSPSASAQLVRDLLGACGVLVVRWGDWVDESRTAYVAVFGRATKGLRIWAGGSPVWRFELPMARVPTLILALLDALALTEGREEAALKALREAGR